MSDMKPTGIEIELGGKQIALLFNINAIENFQDKFNIPIEQLADVLKDKRAVYKNLKYMLMVLINEGIDNKNDDVEDPAQKEKHVDENWVGRKLVPANLPRLQTAILNAFTAGVPISEDGDDPNPESEQQKS